MWSRRPSPYCRRDPISSRDGFCETPRSAWRGLEIDARAREPILVASIAGGRAELSVAAHGGRGCRRSGDVGGVGPPGARNRAACANRPQPVVQSPLAASDRFRGPHHRRGDGAGPAHDSLARALHRPAFGHRRICLRASEPGLSRLDRGAALLQPVPDDLHHPVWNTDSLRPSAPLLDPAQYTGKGLVPYPEAGSGRAVVDREARLNQLARTDRTSRDPALDRPGSLVASRYRYPLASERSRLLRALVLHWPVAPGCADERLRVSRCGL